MTDSYATLADLRAWAEEVIASRPRDFVIGPEEDPYLRRWWIVPRNPFCNVYLHEILRSDDDRALHDHPWASTSLLLAGGYVEHTPEGPLVRRAGQVFSRSAEALHRLEVVRPSEGGARTISLFVTGPKVREWGFACPQGWVHWRDFTAPDDKGLVGRGCGEFSETGESLSVAPANVAFGSMPGGSGFIMPKVVPGLTPGRLDECADTIAHLARRIVGARALAEAGRLDPALARDRERQLQIEIDEFAGGQHRDQAAIEGRRARFSEEPACAVGGDGATGNA